MKLTANVTLPGLIEAGKVYEGQIIKPTVGEPPAFIFFHPEQREWYQGPLGHFVPLGQYAFEGVPISGAQ